MCYNNKNINKERELCFVNVAAMESKDADEGTAVACIIKTCIVLIAGTILLVLYKRTHANIFQIFCSGDVIGLNTTYVPKDEWEFSRAASVSKKMRWAMPKKRRTKK
jgi:hypothetical protein